MKQIVDKLNKIAKKIDESVEIPQTDLIIDSLDAITKAYGGTPNDSNLIVDKLEDIAGVAHSGITPSGNIEITENTAEGEPLNIAQYATATVNVQSGLQPSSATQKTLDNYGYTCVYDSGTKEYIYETFGLPYVMNIKTSAVNYIYDNTEGVTTCLVSDDGKIIIGDGALTSVPFYVNIDVPSGSMTIYGVDANSHHLTISFIATGYPVRISTVTSEDAPYNMYRNTNIKQTYYLYLGPYGDGAGSRGGVIYTGLTNNVPSIDIVKFSGSPK